MAHSHAEVLEVRFDDGRDPKVYENVTYTPYRDGVTVFVAGVAEDHPLAYVVVGPELAAVR
jgi:hypothetical protein